jgi:uncharacterized damage-inducible protein DinB
VDGDEEVTASPAAPERWLRGAVPGIPPLLQPVAHGLLQCRDEVELHVEALSAERVWTAPAGAASIGFHVRHAAASLDRLFTYARGEQLSAAQRAALAAESMADRSTGGGASLVASFAEAISHALDQLRTTTEASLLEPRDVGRARLPSTVLGLLFHAAEHTQRHIGQMVTTIKLTASGS